MPADSPRFLEAFLYASQLHARQLRKGTDIPYISHLLSVAAIVLEHGGTEDHAIAALLHDAVEDQGGLPTLAEIRRRFGDFVADVVDACSETPVKPKPPWKDRKADHLRKMLAASADARLVYAADKLHNARSILSGLRVMGPAVFNRFGGGQEGTLWYYHAMLDLFTEKGPTPLAAELRHVIDDIEQLLATQV